MICLGNAETLVYFREGGRFFHISVERDCFPTFVRTWMVYCVVVITTQETLTSPDRHGLWLKNETVYDTTPTIPLLTLMIMEATDHRELYNRDLKSYRASQII